jgi:hypothetical protein
MHFTFGEDFPQWRRNLLRCKGSTQSAETAGNSHPTTKFRAPEDGLSDRKLSEPEILLKRSFLETVKFNNTAIKQNKILGHSFTAGKRVSCRSHRPVAISVDTAMNLT